MKRILITLFTVAALAVVGASIGSSTPPPSPPGKDPCSHGNSGKPCRPDPQPDRGKECERHGREGGVDEDHCGRAPQPPALPTTTPPGKETEVTVEAEPGTPVVVTGAGVEERTTVPKSGQVTVPVTPTRPGVIRVKARGRVVERVGVPRRAQPAGSLTG
jgi:hypothetical protein